MRRLVLIALGIIGLLLSCKNPSNPYTDPDNAVILQDETQGWVTDSVLVSDNAYPCTIGVSLPALLVNYTVSIIHDGTETVIASDTVSDSLIVFGITANKPGDYTYTVTITKTDGTRDSVSITFSAFSLGPVIAADTSFMSGYAGDTIKPTFSVTDPDGNLLEYYVAIRQLRGVDTTPPDTMEFTASQLSSASIGASVVSIKQDTLLCIAQAMDLDSQLTAVALCTVVVLDSSKPTIKLLEPFDADTTVRIMELPFRISAVVMDASGVDSVHLQGMSMTLSGDTASIEIAAVDSGETTSRFVTAWDAAGNQTTETVMFVYVGNPVFPPEIASVFKAVTENTPFDTIFLDTIVTITDSLATYGPDNIQWSIETGAAELIDTLLAAQRKFVVAVSDSEWNSSDQVVLRATTPDSASATGTLHFQVLPINDAPTITWSDNCTDTSSWFDTINVDLKVVDPDHAPQDISWQFGEGNLFRMKNVSGTGSRKLYLPVLRRGVFLLKGWIGSDTLQAIATDPENGADTTDLVFVIANRCYTIFLPPFEFDPLGKTD